MVEKAEELIYWLRFELPPFCTLLSEFQLRWILQPVALDWKIPAACLIDADWEFLARLLVPGSVIQESQSKVETR